ncbi:IclR family transcriptional regulator [Microbacterium sp. NPDC056569]|uniref:IclR family transcriptional regulator n=1 Tax=Microbacterium sp. NPDC056569 TaxID=3345867 RepID=UPI00366FE36C
MRASAADDGLGVLDRMTRILEAFDQEDSGLRISELATRAGLPKSTVSRLVSTLVRQRYLERDGRLIHLGLRLFELGQLAEQPRELRMAALPVMADLRNRTGENVHLAIRDGGEMVCIAVMRSPSAAAPIVRTGARLPVHATALGKAALAHAVPAEVTDVLGSGLEACTPQTITDPAELQRQLAEIRRGSLAAEVREFAASLSCTAIAVFAPGGGLAGALSVSGCADRFDPDRVAPAVRAAATALARRLASAGAASA